MGTQISTKYKTVILILRADTPPITEKLKSVRKFILQCYKSTVLLCLFQNYNAFNDRPPYNTRKTSPA